VTNRVKVAAIGVGNDISALVQGIALHRATGSLVGIHRSVLDGLSVGDIDFVAAFATSPEKIGKASPMPPRLIALPGSLPGLR
jgi:myo-inositol-1-phosphate synthase